MASPPFSPSRAPCSASSFSSDQFGLASRRCRCRRCRHRRRHLPLEPVPAALLHRFLNNINNNSEIFQNLHIIIQSLNKIQPIQTKTTVTKRRIIQNRILQFNHLHHILTAVNIHQFERESNRKEKKESVRLNELTDRERISIHAKIAAKRFYALNQLTAALDAHHERIQTGSMITRYDLFKLMAMRNIQQ